ncbi:MAG: glycosyltransferase family 4 protein [Butyrivibrio sp.]|nr:glycosyltransferase family 4 protein [Butyrivibrio sp.]
MKNFESLCDLISNVIGADFPYRTEEYEPLTKKLSEAIKGDGWTADELLPLFDKAFASDPQLYTMVLSAVYWALPDMKYMYKVEEVLMTGAFNINITAGLHFQTYHQRFLNGALDDYAVRRTLHRYISQRYYKELDVNIEMVPYEKRNHKFAIVTTYQLLGVRHAPTNLVLSVCHHLQNLFGYTVLLVIIGEPIDSNEFSQVWTGDFVLPNYIDRWGTYALNYHDQIIRCYQFDINKASRDEMINFIGEIYNAHPEFIWQVNGLPRMDQIWRSMTTYVAMPVTHGHEVSDAHLLARYQTGDIPPSADEYVKACGQESIFFHMGGFEVKEEVTEDEYSKKNFGIPEDAFTIGIIGNRIEKEVTEEFREVMMSIIENNPKAFFVFIGDFAQELPEKLEKRSVRLGYRKDFLNCLKTIDLFMNPKRNGGAGGATRAMRAGIPVTTLPDSDVAAFAGDDFICVNYSEMIQDVLHYISDPEYYKSQSEKAKAKQSTLFSKDIKGDFQIVLNKILEIAKTQ